MGCSVAQTVLRWPAQKGATQLRRVQRSSEGVAYIAQIGRSVSSDGSPLQISTSIRIFQRISAIFRWVFYILLISLE